MTENATAPRRCSGVLLHVTSLPGRGIGDLGDAAFGWIDWLAEAGQALWQILPLVPVNEGGSPYNGLSAMAGNDLLVSPERLVADGLLASDEIGGEDLPRDHVDFGRVTAWKESLLRRAFAAFREGAEPSLRTGFERFRQEHGYWLDDYALFRALREEHGGAGWVAWPDELRRREPVAVERWRRRLEPRVEEHAFRQFLFERQWVALRAYAAQRRIQIMGDIPIFVAHDSADVWAHRELFALRDDGMPSVVAGVPPDYFSASGQRWGNPLYRWDRVRAEGYRWWIERFRRALGQVDLVRVDHFRGFEAYWEIPADEPTALKGRWVAGPRDELFRVLEKELGPLPIVAEDLGLITPEVEALRDRLGFPGMRVLQFAFDDDPRNPHLPSNHPLRAVAYTGTHDNATTTEWWSTADAGTRDQARREVGVRNRSAVRDLVCSVMNSRAELAIVPLQDVLGLGAEARMNTPGTGPGNWSWRIDPAVLDSDHGRALRAMTRAAGRLPPRPARESTSETEAP
jgi:4-alpha-glucanotransferase